MSQRLLLCTEADLQHNGELHDYADAVLTEQTDSELAFTRLLRDFFMNQGGYFLGPWKVRIMSIPVLRQHLSVIRQVFRFHGESFPDSCWALYDREGKELPIHSTEELEAFLSQRKAEP